MTADSIGPRVRGWGPSPSALIAVAAALCVAACGSLSGSSGPSVGPSTLTQGAPASSGAATPGTPSDRATPRPTIGQPADDGARIIAVESPQARIRDLTIESPAVGLQKVRLLVPEGFDAQPSTRWPQLFLLHGAYGSYRDWTQFTDIEELTASRDVVVVMPDAGELGFYSDWWNDGRGGSPMWETFHLIELPQLLDRNWRASERRVVAGLSMGGLGAMGYAARRPGMFLAAASYSGVLDTVGGKLDIGTDALWGDPIREPRNWQEHNPVDLAEALRDLPLYVSYGDGLQGPLDTGAVPSDDLEPWIAGQNETFVDRLHQLDIAVIIDAYGAGSHSWPYWERALHRSLPLLLDAVAP